MKGTRKPRAVIYGRSSIANEKSINDQQEENRQAAAAQGWTIAETLSDPTSASRHATKARANWATLLELVPDVDVIVLWEPSRGDRTLASWVTFLDDCRAHATLIHATSHHRTYDPRVPRDYRSLAEDGVDSAYETDRLSERINRGLRAAYQQGRTQGRTEYGYVRVYDTSKTPPRYLRQDPHPEQAPIVVRIFEELAAGVPLYRIARQLSEDGVPVARDAKFWRPAAVRAIGASTRFRPHPDNPGRGCLVRNGSTYVGTWPPLVSEDMWQQVQKRLGTTDAERKARRDKAPGAVKYLLSASDSLLTAPCGSYVAGLRATTDRDVRYTCAFDGCVSVPMTEADEYVIRLACARMARKDARELFVADDTKVKAAEEEAARLRGELEAARRSFETPGGITAETMARKESAMLPAIADAERRARPAGAPLAALELIEAGRFGEEYVRPVWDRLTVTARREVVVAVFSLLRLNPVTVRLTRWTAPEERLAIVADRITHEWRKGTA